MFAVAARRTSAAGVLNVMGVLYSSTLFVGISNCLSVQVRHCQHCQAELRCQLANGAPLLAGMATARAQHQFAE